MARHSFTLQIFTEEVCARWWGYKTERDTPCPKPQEDRQTEGQFLVKQCKCYDERKHRRLPHSNQEGGISGRKDYPSSVRKDKQSQMYNQGCRGKMAFQGKKHMCHSKNTFFNLGEKWQGSAWRGHKGERVKGYLEGKIYRTWWPISRRWERMSQRKLMTYFIFQHNYLHFFLILLAHKCLGRKDHIL